RPGSAEHIDTGRDIEAALGGYHRLPVTACDRLDDEGATEIGQRERHRPRATDRVRHDLGSVRRLERVTHRHGVRIYLEPPETRSLLVQEVAPFPVVTDDPGRDVPGNPAQRSRRRGYRAR